MLALQPVILKKSLQKWNAGQTLTLYWHSCPLSFAITCPEQQQKQSGGCVPSSIMELARENHSQGGCWWLRTPLASTLLVHVQPRMALAGQCCWFLSSWYPEGKTGFTPFPKSMGIICWSCKLQPSIQRSTEQWKEKLSRLSASRGPCFVSLPLAPNDCARTCWLTCAKCWLDEWWGRKVSLACSF